jgi:hypothetical protein
VTEAIQALIHKGRSNADQTLVSVKDVLREGAIGPGAVGIELSILGARDEAIADGVANHKVIAVLATLKDNDLARGVSGWADMIVCLQVTCVPGFNLRGISLPKLPTAWSDQTRFERRPCASILARGTRRPVMRT